MAEKIGNAYLEVTPKFSPNFGQDIKQQTSGIGKSAGTDLGSKFGSGFAGSMKSLISAGAAAVHDRLRSMAQDALSFIGDTFADMFYGFANYEQLAGGVEKIFDQANIDQIMADAQSAYKDLNMSANEYLESINRVGASFAQTMGDQRGYDMARMGMKAIADYASGTGRNIDELNEKFSLITRSTSSYQSIADQFSGILPATSADFLEQAQAAGFLSDKYTSLTQVPIDEYQQAVSLMLEKGVDDMGLLGNTTAESAETVTGSIAQMKAAWQNFLTAIGDGGRSLDLADAANALAESISAALFNIIPLIGRIAATIATQIPGILWNAFTQIPDMIEALWEESDDYSIDSFLMPLKEAAEVVRHIFTEMEPVISAAMDTIYSIMQTVWPTIADTLTGAVDIILTAFDVAWPLISDIAITAFNAIKGVVDLVWPAISAVIDFAITNIKGFIESLEPVVSWVQGIFDGIKSAMEDPIQTARDIIKGAIDRIKSFFEFKIQWPHIPLPHFSISGSINPLDWFSQGLPQIGIEWYARGGFVDGATLIGAGENGAEMILPKQGKMLEDFAQAITDEMHGGGDTFIFNITADSETTLQSLVAQAQRARIAYGRA